MPAKSTGNRYASLSTGATPNKSLLDDIDPDQLGEMIVNVLRAGDAVLFGVTRDGTAIRVMLMSGGDKSSEYFGEADKLHQFCKRVGDHIQKHLL